MAHSLVRLRSLPPWQLQPYFETFFLEIRRIRRISLAGMYLHPLTLLRRYPDLLFSRNTFDNAANSPLTAFDLNLDIILQASLTALIFGSTVRHFGLNTRVSKPFWRVFIIHHNCSFFTHWRANSPQTPNFRSPHSNCNPQIVSFNILTQEQCLRTLATLLSPKLPLHGTLYVNSPRDRV